MFKRKIETKLKNKETKKQDIWEIPRFKMFDWLISSYLTEFEALSTSKTTSTWINPVQCNINLGRKLTLSTVPAVAPEVLTLSSTNHPGGNQFADSDAPGDIVTGTFLLDLGCFGVGVSVSTAFAELEECGAAW